MIGKSDVGATIPRTRLVIGAIAALVIGVAAYVLSRPKAGSVEWHKSEYLQAVKVLRGQTLGGRIRSIYYRIKKTSPIETETETAAEKRRRSSQRQLIQLGYLAQQRFVLADQPALQVLNGFFKTPFGQRQNWEWVDVQEEDGTNVIVLTARPQVVEAFTRYLSETTFN